MVKEFISQLPPDKLSPFAKHPYQVREDAAMDELVESVRTYGILSPLLARPKGEGYELVSGHRRRLAAQKLGLPTVPVLVREMSDDEAVILMVDSNLQRENLLPSEKAFAYKMKLEAMSRQGRRTDLTSTTVVPKFRSNEVIGKESGESRETVRRYIRLTNLVPPLLQMVDDGRIAFSPAVDLSYLTRDEQAARTFTTLVDSAGVYVNCSTRFADGFRYGFGAEVGIATGKVHARGPMGLEGLCIYKYKLLGCGQIVEDFESGKAHFTHRPLIKKCPM